MLACGAEALLDLLLQHLEQLVGTLQFDKNLQLSANPNTVKTNQ